MKNGDNHQVYDLVKE